jgi:hypothetical protein
LVAEPEFYTGLLEAGLWAVAAGGREKKARRENVHPTLEYAILDIHGSYKAVYIQP